jgi:hypothetical protein
MTLYSGEKYTPVYDNLMGVFCWLRKEDGETSLWETGQDAIAARDYASQPRNPEEIDATAALAFEE